MTTIQENQNNHINGAQIMSQIYFIDNFKQALKQVCELDYTVNINALHILA